MHRNNLIEEDSDQSIHYIHYSNQPLHEHSNPQEHTHKQQDHDRPLIDFNDLHRAKDRFKTFLEEIGRLKHTPIRQDITAYCGTQKKSDKNMESHIRP